jgi:hypothetical protein
MEARAVSKTNSALQAERITNLLQIRQAQQSLWLRAKGAMIQYWSTSQMTDIQLIRLQMASFLV